MKYHRHLGVYGICVKDRKLLVIHKNGGPYTARYDLPGGSIEPNETILNTLTREFLEETGIQVRIVNHIGTKDFVVPWTRTGFDHTHCHNIAVLYEVEYIAGDILHSPNIDDSLGAEWINVSDMNESNASPLVLTAKEWMESGALDISTKVYREWTIKRLETF
ncbi:hypothetical protein PAECIP111802_00623 [Paenibacillus allorhizosphaerae]|uniref:Nudix hydrolase domain-containing protein n=2 Tax=Paenibacillus allorhizosphaerae TaxID=2849866 RepID=A0ABM8VBH5_9BACL|nr:NUDIX hydrolase [Paenibacillus allorhizosphaerae]CAG7619807.1 hypothetical protein PAECIP111802_00623 [Paenibacillus allorhizosphaerae]